MVEHKLGIIIPYRHRSSHINVLLNRFKHYFKRKDINYEIFVVNQDDAKLFNRGMLLNIGFTYAKKRRCDYVVFHDVDMIPIDVDYSYSEIPLHLATNFMSDEKKEIHDQYFGGVTMFRTEDFIKINGFSNKYWGWGFEDDDLLLRSIKSDLPFNTIKFKNVVNNGKHLKFNGVDAYVKIKNIIDVRKDITIITSFYTEKIILDHKKENDEYTIFSIPGWDFAISYTSFSRYVFCFFNDNNEPFYVNTEITPNYYTTIAVTISFESNTVKLYQDGKFVGKTTFNGTFKRYLKEKYFYFGAGNPKRKFNPNLFNGYFSNFVYFDKTLTEIEISEIYENISNIKKHEENILCYFDANKIKNYRLIDLSGNNNDGKIVKCEIVEKNFKDYVEVKIPNRRKSIFKLLKHEENGFYNNKWKDQSTRWNQLRYYNEVMINEDLIHQDGLSDLKFIEHGKIVEDNITVINVGI